MKWRIGESLWLIICKSVAVQLIEKSHDGLLSLFLMMMNYIIGPRMICFLSAWVLIKLGWLW
jgi:hypothetical protein